MPIYAKTEQFYTKNRTVRYQNRTVPCASFIEKEQFFSQKRTVPSEKRTLIEEMSSKT